MPRYFFHLYNDITAIDEEGSDLADDRAAMEIAIDSARHVASANVLEGHLDLRHHIAVVSDGGRPVGKVTFGDAVKVLR
ncbi:MAG TPA: hypothetical protein VF470_04830 [Sphingomicrobium sp.]